MPSKPEKSTTATPSSAHVCASVRSDAPLRAQLLDTVYAFSVFSSRLSSTLVLNAFSPCRPALTGASEDVSRQGTGPSPYLPLGRGRFAAGGPSSSPFSSRSRLPRPPSAPSRCSCLNVHFGPYGHGSPRAK